MAPSHSTPQAVAKTIKQIMTLVDSIDNKSMLAYHKYILRSIIAKDTAYDGEYDSELALLDHMLGVKVTLQSERRKVAQAYNRGFQEGKQNK